MRRRRRTRGRSRHARDSRVTTGTVFNVQATPASAGRYQTLSALKPLICYASPLNISPTELVLGRLVFSLPACPLQSSVCLSLSLSHNDLFSRRVDVRSQCDAGLLNHTPRSPCVRRHHPYIIDVSSANPKLGAQPGFVGCGSVGATDANPLSFQRTGNALDTPPPLGTENQNGSSGTVNKDTQLRTIHNRPSARFANDIVGDQQ